MGRYFILGLICWLGGGEAKVYNTQKKGLQPPKFFKQWEEKMVKIGKALIAIGAIVLFINLMRRTRRHYEVR